MSVNFLSNHSWTRLVSMVTLLLALGIGEMKAANTVHVSAGGADIGDYATLNAAFDAASGRTNPVITLTDNTTFTCSYTYNPGAGKQVTLDLNNFTITTTGTTTSFSFKLTSGKLTITDNSAERGGVWNMETDCNGTLIGIYPIGGEVVLAGGKVYVYNTASGKSTYGVQTESSGVYTQTGGVLEVYGKSWTFGVSIKKSATISGGTLQATSSNGASGIACYFWGTSATLSVSGGRLISDKILGNPANASSLSITGGCFSNLNTYNWSTGVTTANLADYVDASTYDILTLTSDNPEYAKGSRYMVAPKGTTVQVYTTEGTTGFTTLNAAFDYAKAKKAPLITLIDNTTYTIPYASYQPTVSDWRGTLDLNNKKITTSGSVDNNFIFRINKSDMKLTITDNSAEGGGVWNLTAPYSSALNGIDIYSGELELAGGKVHADNTTSGQSLYGIKTETAGTYTQTGGILDVTRSVSGGTNGLGIVGNVTISGGKINAPSGYATIFFSGAKTLTISGGKFIVGTGVGFIMGNTERATSIALTGGYYSNLRAYISGATSSITACMDASTYQTFDVTSNPEYSEGCRYLIAPKTATVEVKHDAGIAYCATLNAAFDEAKSKSNPVMTLIANTTFTGQYILSPTIADWRGTLDLNNKTVTTASTSANIIFYVNKSDMKLTVTDSSSGGNGAWNSEVSYDGTLTAIRVERGELVLEGGKLHATNSATNKAIYGVTAAANGKYTQTAGVNEAVNPTGGAVYTMGVQGIVNVSGGTISASSSNNESDAFIFLGTAGAGTQKLTISGGKFKAGTYIANYAERASTFNVTGGYYSTCTIHKTSPVADVNLDTYCVSPKHPVLMSTTESSPLGMPDNSYKVVAAHTLTWNLDGGTVSTAGSAGGCAFPTVGATGTPSRYVADGASISAPTLTKTGYSFSSWSPTVVSPMPESDKEYTAQWSCVNPSSLSIASTGNKWDFCAGESMTLTVIGSNIAADATYQWKLGGSNIAGATSASYTTAMAAAKAGAYTCTVTNPGSCATTTADHYVRVWQLHLGDNDIDFENTGTGTGNNTAVLLSSDTHYEFKLKDNTGGWFGLNDKTLVTSESNITLNGTGANVNLNSGLAGNYTFAINYSDKNFPKISVTYPLGNQPSGRKIYFDKSAIDGWGSNVYYRIGRTTYNSNQTMSLVPGTDQFYEVTTNEFNNFEAWHIANNVSWSGDNSIYYVNGSGYAITKATDFQKYVVGTSGVTIVPTGSHNTESGCNYWYVSKTDGMLTHTATIGATTNGTIHLAYTDVNSTAQDKTSTTAGLAHRCRLTVTATPSAGYECTSLTVNGAAFTSGNIHILAADATIAATFAPVTLAFTGSKNSQWSDADNWSPKCVPTLNHDVTIQAPCSVDIPHAKAKSVVIYNNGSDKTGKLNIGANKGLEVTGTITKTTNGSSYGPTAPADLVLESAAAGNASLIFNNSNSCQATVYMYSKATYPSGGPANWQYIGTPFTGSQAYPNYMGSWLYRWRDDCSGNWDPVSNDHTITAFTGYCLTQSSAKTLEMTGTLNASSSQNITVPAGKERVVANSWTGPIFIRQLRDADFGSMAKTVYLFNTGNDPNGEGTVDRNADAAGTYRAIPIHSSPYMNDSVISSMQGFYVKNTSGSAQTLALSYADHVRPARTTDAILNGPMRARKEELSPEVMRVMVNGSRYGTDLYLLSREDFSRGYDDGWDGENINEAGAGPLMYTLREDGTKDAVSAIPAFEGAVVGFHAGEDSEYTFSFSYNGDEVWYLNDLLTETSTLISAENTYTFATTDDDAVRFVISATPLAKTPQGVESIQPSAVSVQKELINDQLYIKVDERMYDATGKLVEK